MIRRTADAMVMTLLLAAANEEGVHVYIDFCPICAEYEQVARIVTSDTPSGQCGVCLSEIDNLKPMWRYKDGRWITEPSSSERLIVSTCNRSRASLDQPSDVLGAGE